MAKLMVLEVEQVVGAAKGQPAPAARTTSRQGYRERPRPTRWRTLE
ncbi:MAG TPA: hypothetical protein VES89_03040 [Candidatus Competibacteraceae bacterium]|nr:hypothetical protein [Candidatus Competibacteraceae bacterium]